MWSLSQSLRAVALFAALLATALLAGCTVSPVHGSNADAGQLSIAAGTPANRLQQVAYRTLSQRLDFAEDPEASVLTLAVGTSDARPGLSSVARPTTQREVLANVTYRVTTPEGELLASGSRSARASYFSSAQAVANDTAAEEARERATAAAAEAVRLALLAQFGAP